MPLKIYNTLSKKKEEFLPWTKAGEDVCLRSHGVRPVPHRPCPRGRGLRHHLPLPAPQGYQVNYVQNYTDVDDKIIKRANQEESPARLSRAVHPGTPAGHAGPGHGETDSSARRPKISPDHRLGSEAGEKGFAYASTGRLLFGEKFGPTESSPAGTWRR